VRPRPLHGSWRCALLAMRSFPSPGLPHLPLLLAVGIALAGTPAARAGTGPVAGGREASSPPDAGPGGPPAETGSSPDEAPVSPATLLAEALERQRAGDFAAAASAYERLVALVPANPALRSNLGAAYAGLGRFDDAITQYREALTLGPNNYAIRHNLALALYKAGHIREASVEAAAVVAGQPDNVRALGLLADCYLRMGQNAKVVELLQPLGERVSEDRALSYMLGMALLAEGRTAEAEQAIDRVLRGDTPEAHVFLAAMFMKDDDCVKAVPEIKMALAASPQVPLANYFLGKCLMDDPVNDWKGAAEAFRRELASDPNHFESNLLLGNLLREGARHEEALPLLERAARLRPDDIAARFSLGAVYVALGRTEEALPLLESVAATVPDHLQTHMQLAIVYHRLGRAADEARERATVGRLQQEGENRFFKGVSDALARLLGKTAAPAAAPSPAQSP
jgi:predicted Zn-dependent protease